MKLLAELGALREKAATAPSDVAGALEINWCDDRERAYLLALHNAFPAMASVCRAAAEYRRTSRLCLDPRDPTVVATLALGAELDAALAELEENR